MIYLVEADAFDPASEAVVTRRFGTVGYTTEPADTPPNAFFDPRIQEPGSYDRNVFRSGTTSGETTVGAGEIVLQNPDGGLDDLIDLAFDGRALRILALADADAAYSSATVLLKGVLEQPEFSFSRVTLRIRDRLAELREPIQPLTYAGTTTAGGMDQAEGRPEDLKGQPKPLLFGRARGIPAVEANAYDLIYQVSSRALASIEGVYDRGVALTLHADYATVALLRAATIPAGKYGMALALGLIRLASTPAGQVTVDASEGATTADRSAARIARRILEAQAGMTAGADLATASFDALHTANPAPCGIWIGPEPTDVLGPVTAVLDSIGGYLVPSRLGIFGVGRIVAPSGTPAAAISTTEILDRGQGIERQATRDDGRGIPAWKVTVRYGRNYAVQSASDLDQVNATVAYKAFAPQDYRSAVATDPDVKAAHLLAPELVFDTLLVSESDAAAEAARRLALYGVRRDLFSAPLPVDEAATIDLGQVVSVTLPRFGMAAGKSLLVIGLTEEFGSGVTTLGIWG